MKLSVLSMVLFLSAFSWAHADELSDIDLIKARVTQLEKQQQLTITAKERLLKTVAGNKLRKSSLNKSSFSVQLSEDTSNIDTEIIQFDNVIWGNFSSAGYFECLNDGTYSFTVTIVSPPAKKSTVYLQLARSGVEETRLIDVSTYMYDPVDASGTHSVTVIAEAKAGDRASISVRAVGSGSTNGMTELLGGGTATTFMGYEI